MRLSSTKVRVSIYLDVQYIEASVGPGRGIAEVATGSDRIASAAPMTPAAPPSRRASPSSSPRRPSWRPASDYGELRLLALAMIAEQPQPRLRTHGRGIEEQIGSSSTPSPGVISPTLAWLEGTRLRPPPTPRRARSRRHSRLAAPGKTFLAAEWHRAHRCPARPASGASRTPPPGRRPGPGAAGNRDLEELALRLRLRDGRLEPAAAEAVAAALDSAAQAVDAAEMNSSPPSPSPRGAGPSRVAAGRRCLARSPER